MYRICNIYTCLWSGWSTCREHNLIFVGESKVYIREGEENVDRLAMLPEKGR